MLSAPVGLREAGLNALLGIRSSHVLNADSSTGAKLPFAEISKSLATAMLTFKSEVMDANGKHLDYASLQVSEAYRHYKSTFTSQLTKINLSSFSSASEQRAFWINLYNSLTIDAVISFGVSRSVTEGWLGILRFFRRAAYNVGGRRFSLEDIEHGVLRANKGHPYIPGPQFSGSDSRSANVVEPFDPRIHFALNCASRSCPPIGVYTAKDLDQQLDLAARNFIREETRLNEARNRLRISSIFKWYWKDFGGPDGVRNLLLEMLPQTGERYTFLVRSKGIPFRFLPYHWELNLKGANTPLSR